MSGPDYTSVCGHETSLGARLVCRNLEGLEAAGSCSQGVTGLQDLQAALAVPCSRWNRGVSSECSGAKSLLFCRCKGANVMKTLIETQKISVVWIINNSRLTVFLLIFSFDSSLLKNQTYFRKAECKHYFIPLLWVLSGAMFPLLFIFSFSFRKEECFLFVNRCKVLACAKMPGIWPSHMLAGHGLHLKQEKCRELG